MDDNNDDYYNDTSSDSSAWDNSSTDNGSTEWNNMDPPEDDDAKLEEWAEQTGNPLPIQQSFEVNGEYVTVGYDGTITNSSGMPIGQIDQQDVASIQYDDSRLSDAVNNTRGSGSSGSDNSGGGCYIATAVYGSYDTDEVLVLRHFRDSYLLKRHWGKQFVRLYYKYSPAFAEKLKGITFLNRTVKGALNLFVRKLRKQNCWETGQESSGRKYY